MDKTTFVTEIEIDTPDGPVALEVHLAPEGGYFAIDSSYLDQVSEKVYNPFGHGEKIICTEFPYA